MARYCRGLQLRWRQVAEAESCIHPPQGQPLVAPSAHGPPFMEWFTRRLNSSRYRLGITRRFACGHAPAVAESRGARGLDLDAGSCIAYHMAGHWAFAKEKDDAVARQVRERLEFLADDAPARRLNLPVPVTCKKLMSALSSPDNGRTGNFAAIGPGWQRADAHPSVARQFWRWARPSVPQPMSHQ